MTPIFASKRLDWSNAIGLFILNFGQLDWQLLVFLESRMPADEFARIKARHFHDRVAQVKKLVASGSHSPTQRQAFEDFVTRVEPIRALRNHIAHGHILSRLSDDLKTWKLTLSLPKDLNTTEAPETRHLEFSELTRALGELDKLIRMIEVLDGNWTRQSLDSGQMSQKSVEELRGARR